METQSKTNARDFRAFILANVDATGYGVEPKTDAERVAFLRDTFTAEYGWATERYGNRQRAILEWLQGLPSSVRFPFYNVDILALAVERGILAEDYSERRADTVLREYWRWLAASVERLFCEHEMPHSRAFWKQAA